jgi:5-(carboxyamino)imidazole ribonucleotide synthase
MLAMAAARLGLRVHTFDPDPCCPAADVSKRLTVGRLDDAAAMERFADSVDAITFEWESVPTDALRSLAHTPPIRPPADAVCVLQDRLSEKRFLEGLGLRVAPFEPLDDPAELERALERIGGVPAIAKTRHAGYDGKGQVRVTRPDDLGAARALVARQPCVLEGFVRFEREVSVIAARSTDGTRTTYEPGENVHRDGILHTTHVPARLSSAQRDEAVAIAERILTGLDYVGVLGVELFVTPGGLLVNEVAPRVHNSGHWTEAGCQVDQFEQHIRAVAGWPLGPTTRHADVTMENLIGHEVERWSLHLGNPAASLRLYGKSTILPGRKMGHVNRIDRRSAP